MKISEIRNNLFNLSDLKGLIGESIEKEYKGSGSFDWQGFFTANPERLNMSFLKAMGLKKAPESVMGLDQIGDSEIRKYFGDKAVLDIHSNPAIFKKVNNSYTGIANNYEQSRKNWKKKMINELDSFFKERFKSTMVTPENVTKIYNIALEARKENPSMKILFSSSDIDLNNPFSIFLFFFYDLQTRQGNAAFIDKTINDCLTIIEEYDAQNGTNFLGAIQSLVGNFKNEKKISKIGLKEIIDETLSPDLGLTFLNRLNDEIISKISQKYFVEDPGLSKLLSIISIIEQNSLSNSAFNEKTLKEYRGTAGGFLLTAMSVIYNCLNGRFDDGLEIASNIIGDNLYSRVRATCFEFIYRTKFNLDTAFIENIMSAFQTERFVLFDFLAGRIDMDKLNNGFVTWYRNYGVDAFEKLSMLKQTTFSINKLKEGETKNGLLIEIIADAAAILLNIANQKYTKYDTKTTINFLDLITNASEGLKKMASDESNVPVPQQRLRELSTTFGERDVKLWEVLNADNNIDDKTQMDIFIFLKQNSDGDVFWDYEYNRPGRSDKVDKDLGQKSIDIMGTKNNKKICFEYQGEQHFRPINVRESDYENQFFTGIRNAILNRCGYFEIGLPGTRFVKRTEAKKLSKKEQKEIILAVFSDKLEELAKMQQLSRSMGSNNDTLLIKEPVKDKDRKKRTNILKEVFHIEPTNRRDLTIDEAAAYFSAIVSRGVIDESYFRNPEVGGIIPYIGSPFRFLEELKTAEDMSNDQLKSDIVKKKGWIMSYIIPKNSTPDEVEYTKQMATNGSVFTWNKTGKEEILKFLVKNNFRTNVLSENRSSLFEDVVKELLRENSFE